MFCLFHLYLYNVSVYEAGRYFALLTQTFIIKTINVLAFQSTESNQLPVNKLFTIMLAAVCVPVCMSDIKIQLESTSKNTIRTLALNCLPVHTLVSRVSQGKSSLKIKKDNNTEQLFVLVFK